MSLFAHIGEPHGTRLVSERDLIQALGLSRTTLWRLRKEGLPSFTAGRTVRYDLEKVKVWLEANDPEVRSALLTAHTGQDDGLADCHWSLSVALDPKHRPQEPTKPASTARREWWRYPQEAHLLDRNVGRYRRLVASEVAAIQGFPKDWGRRAVRDELLLMRGYGDAVPPSLSEAVFAEVPSLLGLQPRTGVEICAGFGGMALGEARALELRHLALFERWDVACEVLRSSGSFDPNVVREEDLRSVDWGEFAGRTDLLAGGPPCQPWSQGGKGLGTDDDRDLLGRMPEVVSTVAPKAFVFENVPGLLSGENEPYSRSLIERLRHAGGEHQYGVALAVLNAADFGVPQRRRRVFIVGARGKTTAEVHSFFDRVFAKRTHADPRLAAAQGLLPWKTLGEAIIDWREPKALWRRWPISYEGHDTHVTDEAPAEVTSAKPPQIRIGLNWPSRGRAVAWDGTAWTISEDADKPTANRAVPLIPDADYAGDPLSDPWLVLGEPMTALDALRRQVGRQAMLAYVDTPRIKTNAGSFDAADREKVLDTWLSVCRATLKRAIGLLDDRGALSVICGIDETVYVRQLLDELLGAQNHIGTVAWQKGYSPRNMPNMRELSPVHDNIVLFARRKDVLAPVALRLPSSGFKNPDGDPRGFWKAEQKGANKPDCDYSVNIPPYRWAVTEGELPPGLWRLSPKSGVIFGVPSAPGRWAFEVTVTDQEEQEARRRFAIEVTEAVDAPPLPRVPWLIADGSSNPVRSDDALSIATEALPPARLGSQYSAVIIATGGNPWIGTTRPGKTAASGKGRYWEFPATTLLTRTAQDSVDFKSKDDAIPALKVYEKGAERRLNQTTLWFGRGKAGDPTEVDYSQDAKQELEALAAAEQIQKIVAGAKPAKLMTRLLALFTSDGATVIDVGSPGAEMAAVAVAAGRRAIYVGLPGSDDTAERLWLPRLRLAAQGRHPLPDNISFSGDDEPAEGTYILDGRRREERSGAEVQVMRPGAPFADVDPQMGSVAIRYDEYSAGSRGFLAALASVEGLSFVPPEVGGAFATSRDGRTLGIYLPAEDWLDPARMQQLAELFASHLERGGRLRIYYHRGPADREQVGNHQMEPRRIPFALLLSAGLA